ncbi:MAG TPA: methyltransferase domain-containing protein [Chloroflexia bacterium]
MAVQVDLYNDAYGNFAKAALAQVRRDTYGEDVGQSSWMTTGEYRQFFAWLGLAPESLILDVGSGSGGPALFMARTVGCRVVGVDINENGIATANAQAQGVADQVRFQHIDAGHLLPFAEDTFDAIVCIDAILHIPDRVATLAEWWRVLRPGGRILFTDPVIVTGFVTKEELATRSSIGYFLFAPVGADERAIQDAGLELIHREDVTDNAAQVSKRWHDSRARHRADLISVEGETTYEGVQQFLAVVHGLTSERRLSRFVFVAQKSAR